MPQNRLKHFPTALLRRGMAHFHPALPLPGSIPPSHERLLAMAEAGGPRPVDGPREDPAAPVAEVAEPALAQAA